MNVAGPNASATQVLMRIDEWPGNRVRALIHVLWIEALEGYHLAGFSIIDDSGQAQRTWEHRPIRSGRNGDINYSRLGLFTLRRVQSFDIPIWGRLYRVGTSNTTYHFELDDIAVRSETPPPSNRRSPVHANRAMTTVPSAGHNRTAPPVNTAGPVETSERGNDPHSSTGRSSVLANGRTTRSSSRGRGSGVDSGRIEKPPRRSTRRGRGRGGRGGGPV